MKIFNRYNSLKFAGRATPRRADPNPLRAPGRANVFVCASMLLSPVPTFAQNLNAPAIAAAPLARAQPLRDLYADTWSATDALGRAMPTGIEVGAPTADKQVGIFYFLWQERPGDAVNDLTEIYAANPANPQLGGVPSFHWWGEPLLGYYVGYDPFVIRKHAQMLSDVGRRCDDFR